MINEKQLKDLIDIKNSTNAYNSINNEYIEIINTGSKNDKKKLFNSLFALRADVSRVRRRETNSFSDEFCLEPMFHDKNVKSYLTIFSDGYAEVIKTINTIESNNHNDNDINIAILSEILYELSNKVKDETKFLKKSYTGEFAHNIFKTFFSIDISTKKINLIINEGFKRLDIRENHFQAMYQSMREAKIITHEMAEINIKTHVELIRIMNTALENYYSEDEQYTAITNKKTDLISKAGSDISTTPAIDEKLKNLAKTRENLISEYERLERKYKLISSNYENNYDNKRLHLQLKFNFAGMEKEFISLTKKTKESKEEVTVFNGLMESLITRSEIKNTLPNKNVTGNFIEEEDTIESPEQRQRKAEEEITRQMEEVRLKKEEEKNIKKEKYVEQHNFEREALIFSKSETSKEDINKNKFHELSSSDYAVLVDLFDRAHKKDFELSQLKSLATACGAEEKPKANGYMMVFQTMEYAFLPNTSVLSIASATDYESAWFSTHNQHNSADRKVQPAVVSAFRKSLTKAGFTPETCIKKTAASKLAY